MAIRPNPQLAAKLASKGKKRVKAGRRRLKEHAENALYSMVHIAARNYVLLNNVTWRDYFPRTLKEAAERALPYTALILLVAPFTTTDGPFWNLASLADGSQRLGAWGGVSMESVWVASTFHVPGSRLNVCH